jgi:hypothetical protein
MAHITLAGPKKTGRQGRFLSGLGKPIRAVMVLLLLLLIHLAFAQEQNLKYAIHRNGKKVGDLSLQKRQSGGVTSYHIESEVKVRVVMAVVVQAREQSVYENELLQSSSLVRHVNGRQKANKQIRNNGSGLTVTDEGTEQVLKNYSVRYSTHCLYTTEPVSFTNVFSDNYKKFIPIVKLADHHYKLSFPDGNSNEYFYENGICRKVKVKNQLFDAEFVLISL